MNKKKLALLPKLQQGGKAYIPDGKMHRYKHKIDPKKVGTDLSENGIPLVAEICDSGNCRITQVAEIEAAEIIFTNEQSNQIERMVEKYNQTKDESILEKLGEEIKKYLSSAEDETGKYSTHIKRIS